MKFPRYSASSAAASFVVRSDGRLPSSDLGVGWGGGHFRWPACRECCPPHISMTSSLSSDWLQPIRASATPRTVGKPLWISVSFVYQARDTWQRVPFEDGRHSPFARAAMQQCRQGVARIFGDKCSAFDTTNALESTRA